MKHKRKIAFALVLVLTLSALTASAFAAPASTDAETGATAQTSGSVGRESKSGEKLAAPENAIGKDAAKEKALSDAGVTAEQAGKVKARLSQLDDGTVIYKVSFTCDGQKYSYQIGAVSGAIVDKSAEAATGDPSTASGGHGKRGGKQETAEPENAIGKDAAKETALSDAGVTAEQAGRVKARVTALDDGTVIYKVSFTCDGQKYSYQIDALSGEIVGKGTEAVSEDAASASGAHGRHGRDRGGKTALSTAEDTSSDV